MAKIEVKVPSVGESVTEVILGQLMVESGAFVQEDISICELESDKASVEVPAPKSGVITFTKKQGDTLAVGEAFAVIDTQGKGKEHAPVDADTKDEAPKPVEKVVDKVEQKQETSGGIRESLDEHIKQVEQKQEVVAASVAKESSVKESSKKQIPESGETERKKMPKIRTIIAKRLVGVKNETAMLTTFNEVDMSAVMAMRSREKDSFLKKHGVKLTFMPFFMKAAAQALTEFAEVNAYIDGDEIVYNKNVHMGIAVSTEKGLVVPVIRAINKMSMVEMTHAMNEMALKGRDGKLSISDMSGGTFTITNGGVFGSMLSTPILNPPQSAILGLHNIVERPVVKNGKVEVAPIMYLALSYDHRIIDGKDSVQFLMRIKELVEDPSLYILGE
ncbi:MAG: Dihydrolipoyllysine-residue succinyltransferase component of 2-oxoglutarate dehydrogenase complex [Chlamydiia bacterium]|nr:Dihydrolipoyllysine-residue succinyltransferase component of 2-oxoglutarate dehydrogenase complex [Chlamydiia bacterium]MCH9618217.1 Dihydrolipoyllysine-residue succinyltransferase component of 2-oxoglutarate dehydrogenase complex [Chlamydiia bacterium]MCH9624060.1 Dihydrolipoyllysine-residue succinyltransferase component of 2-oxoglutarate dehydrogenase complex [Chlamydiia bacterium]